MDFNRWWERNEELCKGKTLRDVALAAWQAVKSHHRIPPGEVPEEPKAVVGFLAGLIVGWAMVGVSVVVARLAQMLMQ